jgi:hypothetical protein
MLVVEEQVPHHEQRPGVPQDVEGAGDRAAGPRGHQ